MIHVSDRSDLKRSWSGGDATRVTVTAANVPAGISAEDHQAGVAASLENLERFLRA